MRKTLRVLCFFTSISIIPYLWISFFDLLSGSVDSYVAGGFGFAAFSILGYAALNSISDYDSWLLLTSSLLYVINFLSFCLAVPAGILNFTPEQEFVLGLILGLWGAVAGFNGYEKARKSHMTKL